MSSAPSQIPNPNPSPRGGERRRRSIEARRASRRRRHALESLEARTLLAVLPAVETIGHVNLSGASNTQNVQTSDESSPSIVIDQSNPDRLFSVWTRRDTNLPAPTQVVLGGSFSTNGGLNWTSFNATGQVLIDPQSPADNPQPYARVDNGSVAVDRDGNIYVLQIQHREDNNAGHVRLSRYRLNPAGTAMVLQNVQTVYAWNRSADPAVPTAILQASLAVDDTLATFTDPETGQTTVNPNAGNVYIAWTADTPPPDSPPPNWNRYTVQLLGSSDLGLSFSAPVTLGAGNAFNTNPNERNAWVRLTVSQGQPGLNPSVRPGQVTAVYHDFNGGGTLVPPQDLIFARAVHVSPGVETPTLSMQARQIVATTVVRGSQDGLPQFPLANPTTAKGIGPAPTIASDNTLGSFSPNQGRLYIAFVDRWHIDRDNPVGLDNPTTNTDIFLAFSDDGGASWTRRGLQVNDDDAFVDGGSQATTQANPLPTTGRPQYLPEVAVDQATGTLLLSWYDARDDAANARVARYITTSIDGGSSFAPQTFLNPPQAPFDVALRTNVNLGPRPDNQSAGNPNTETVFGFGTRQGLAVHGGRVYSAWSGNLNGGNFGNDRLDIYVARSVIAGGPRIVASTMGVVEPQSFARLDTGARVDINSSVNTFGVPVADGFVVTFDRPVNPATFSAADVQVFYRNPDQRATDPGTAVPVLEIIPLRLGSTPQGPTQFIVRFAPSSLVGTYSYRIGPNVNDRIRTQATTASPIVPGNPMDQNANAVEGELATGNTQATRGDVYSPFEFGSPYPEAALPLQITGPRLINTVSYATAQPVVVPGGGVGSSSIFVGGDPNLQVTDLNVTVNLAYPQTNNIRLILVGPDGTEVVLIEQPPIPPPTANLGLDGTVFDDQASTQVIFGQFLAADYGQRFIGRFQPSTPLVAMAGRSLAGTWTLRVENGPTAVIQGWGFTAQTTTVLRDVSTTQETQAITIRFDRDMDPASITVDDLLPILGPGGPYNAAQIVAAPNLDPLFPDPDPAFPRTYQVILPRAAISGQYLARLSPTVLSRGGVALDSNQNAGLDNFFGRPTEGVEPVTFASTGPVNIVSSPAGTVFTSTLNFNQNFPIADVVVQIDIDVNDARQLTVVLVAPDDTEIQLFSRLPVAGSNFRNTIFDDAAPTPITNAGPPYSGRFAPQPDALGGTLGNLAGLTSAGTWRLRVTVEAAGITGRINSWALTLGEPIANNGLGEPVADLADVPFRVFTMDPTDPLSSNTWTAVGPTGAGARGPNLNAQVAGRVNNVVLDPSDPSGNIAFAATPSGGLWKTYNLLTSDPTGPTWLPLLDDITPFGLNIGDVAVVSINNDPNQTAIFVATGDADATGDANLPGRPAGLTARGVGFLRSLDGGLTWTLLDSLDNTQAQGSRDRHFASVPGQPGVTTFRLIADPNPVQDDPTRLILFAAVSDINAQGQAIASGAGDKGGLYRSLDSGNTWQRVRAGQATDVVFDPSSQSAPVGDRPGNLQFLYAAFRGDGVYFSPNQGDVFNPVLGNIGKPLVQTGAPQPAPVPVGNPSTPPTPNIAGSGRIILAKPAPTGNDLQDLIYRGWLYAAVVQNLDVQQAPNSDFIGLYLTKDFGQNWTKIDIAAVNVAFNFALPTNTPGTDYPITGNGTLRNQPFHTGNFNFSIAVDPLNPNVVYLGGSDQFQSTGLIRIDATSLHDPHAFFLNNLAANGGLRTSYSATSGGVQLADPVGGIPMMQPPYDPRNNPFLNLVRNPADPFNAGATVLVNNTASFINDGAGARWIPFDQALAPDPFAGGTDPWSTPARGVHGITTLRDPVTGLSRLIFSTDYGIFSVVADRSGQIVGSVGGVESTSSNAGDTRIVNGSRNGNLQVAQIYSGAAQASQLSAQLAALQGFFYASTETTGTPRSDANILNPASAVGYGNLTWSAGVQRGPTRGTVAVQQELQLNALGVPTSGGTFYQYRSSEGLISVDGRPSTDTWQVNNVARTFGMYQAAGGGDTPDGQWPFRPGFVFAVNPINGDQAVIGSAAGRIFATRDRGLIWSEVGNPGALDGSRPTAVTFGAPLPGVTDVLQLDDYVLVGTQNGNVFVTFSGGGSGGGTGNAWINLGSPDGTPIRSIVAEPNRGSGRIYVATQRGVYRMENTRDPASRVWVNTTGNLPLPQSSTDFDAPLMQLGALAVDWRYVIPADFTQPSSPTHPVLYVGGQGGVWRSLNNGNSWIPFPDSGENSLLDSPLGSGGGLPNVLVTDLDLSLGNIDPQTGRPNSINPQNPPPALAQSLGTNTLTASTYGRGMFTIRLAPIVFPNPEGTTPENWILRLDPNPRVVPGSSPAVTVISDTGLSNTDSITREPAPFVIGFSEQTAFGNLVRISLYEILPDGSRRFVGGFDPSNPSTDIAANRTDTDGRFAVRINPGAFADDGTDDGVKIIGVEATNISGTRGNIATFHFTLDTIAPEAAARPDLLDVTDTGLRDDDEITNPNIVVTPNTGRLQFATTFIADPTGAFTQATLYRGAAPIGAPVLGASDVILTEPGPFTPGDPNRVADGTYVYTVRLMDLAGNISEFSTALNVRIDTVAPPQPERPSLLAADDSGTVGDNITNVQRPRFVGSAQPNTQANPNDPTITQRHRVDLVDQAGNVIGIGEVSPQGQYTVQPTNSLNNGIYTFRVRITDIAGNVSSLSEPRTVEILNRTFVPAPTLLLVPQDDSGTVGDNITNVTRPRFTGTGPAGLNLNVQIINIDTGQVLMPQPGTPPIIIGDSGTYLTQPLPFDLPQATYRLVARITDVAGNVAESPVLVLQIRTAGSDAGPLIRLNPANDTGTPGDNITSSRQISLINAPGGPQFEVGTRIALFEQGRPLTLANELGRGTVAANGSSFSIPVSRDPVNGTITVVAHTIDVAGNYGAAGNVLTIRIVTAEGDFNGDGKADLGVYSRNDVPGWFGAGYLPSGGFVHASTPWPQGRGRMVPFQGDFNGDGISDYGVFDDATATWYIRLRFANGSVQDLAPVQFGWPGVALPIPADYDGDGKTDIAVYQPNEGLWLVRLSGGGVITRHFGWGSNSGGQDQAVPADYNGDGKADFMLFRPQTSEWIGLFSNGQSFGPYQFGWAGVDRAAPADYDGDGKVDLGLFRPVANANGQTAFLIKSVWNLAAGEVVPIGRPGDIPVPMDFNGDGIADPAVFRPGAAEWYVRQSIRSGNSFTRQANATLLRQFGTSDGLPPGAPLYPYRLPIRTPLVTAPAPGGGGGVQALSLPIGSAVGTAGLASSPTTPAGTGGPAGLASAGQSFGASSVVPTGGSDAPAPANDPGAASALRSGLARRQEMLRRLADRRRPPIAPMAASTPKFVLTPAVRPDVLQVAGFFRRRLG